MRRKTKITIGICAYNEEKNIQNILSDIVEQKQDSFILESIVINCDGCTDNTVSIIKKFQKNHAFVKLINHKKSLGKIVRMNELFRKNSSPILISADADIRLQGDEVLTKLVETMVNEKADIVSAKDTPDVARSFFERVIQCWISVWDNAKWSHNNGKNVFTLSARLMVLRQEFIKNVQIPTQVAIDDQFLFYTSIQQGKKYATCPSAVAIYKLPNTIQDFKKQSLRYQKTKELVKTYFGPWIEQYETIPFSTKMRSLIKIVFKDPIFLFLAVTYNSFCSIQRDRCAENLEGGRWLPVASTK